ncbi:16S rRNA (uracil(1498)-N(3))-methyltransferase [Mariprofundus erugo]|uniref:Ribosomal RNA small subunit methyltransferase E n=1 Tax=Mariprofundus erugo TaxID=2528639 RepID=A0A5R9GV84_9PROT|nr:16S rRNA (uracil(1498)-N(3))-methyltransferase [Mariprofundus erugo]TLS68193.1 16S rRNA (uracil(1498)-N(3))-methyltransferase [Mariprofundus erugo]TLS73724.1 16S rRNA (uracil(1498)-N(3))-methyltransferase [Mariprofundus erugo]
MSCRVFINQPLKIGTSVELPADQAHYLRHVMRHNAGDPLTLFNGQGGEFDATIENLSKQHASCLVSAHHDVSREMACRVHIVQSACRSEKIETVLQKATELGAASFHITRSERSSLKLEGSRLDARLDRWQKIITEASEQSGRTIVPSVSWHHHLADVPCHGSGLTLHPHTDQTWPQTRDILQAATDITLAIGPEGGWSDQDIATLEQLGFACIAFGPRILRTETAAPALLAAIQAIRPE